MPTFTEFLRNILVVLLILAALSWLLSFIRATFRAQRIPGRKEEVFNKLLTILKEQKFNIRAADPINGRIVTEALVTVIDIIFYRLIGNRVIFDLTELSNNHVQVKVYGHASFLFLKASIRKSDEVVDEEKINRILADLMKA